MVGPAGLEHRWADLTATASDRLGFVPKLVLESSDV